MRCQICQEEAEPKAIFCTDHAIALANLQQAFGHWTKGYGKLSLDDFLKRIQKLPGTGEKVRELAKFFLANPSRWT